jgi:enoyl-CoA hydratase/carnithine racemase
MTAIIQARLPVQVAHEVVVTGTRYGAEQALASRIVDATASEDEVVSKAIALAAPYAPKSDPVMQRLKSDLYPQVLAAIRAEMA